MNLKRVPIDRLRELLAATERTAGADSTSAEILRRELNRREKPPRRKPASNNRKGAANATR